MKIGFIGCGNMGGSLARAICRVMNTTLYISDYNNEKAQAVAEECGGTACDNIRVARECDFIFLAVKPNLYSEVIPPLSEALSENGNSVVVSIAAGVSISRVEELIGSPHKVIRIMPNTPVAVGEGMIVHCHNGAVSDDDIEEFERIMSEAGRLDAIDEELIDAASALSGCGPAFVYMYAAALAKGASDCGLDEERAIIYAAQTLRGAAKMLLVSGKGADTLREEVCSPGGSTIEGVKSLWADELEAVVRRAVGASYRRTRELGKN